MIFTVKRTLLRLNKSSLSMKHSASLFLMFMSICVVESNLYKGKCPSVNNADILPKEIKCRIDREMKVIGAVQTSASVLNIFHNQYGSLRCLNVNLKCINSRVYLASLTVQCKALNEFKTCYPIRIRTRDNSTGANELDFSFQPTYYCNEKSMKNQIFILDYVEASYMLIWGCWEKDKYYNEQGVWILSTQAKMPKEDYKLRATNLLSKINHNLVDDLLELESETDKKCRCVDCNYFMQCKLAKSSGQEIDLRIILFLSCIFVSFLM